jgi:hypothetical protein
MSEHKRSQDELKSEFTAEDAYFKKLDDERLRAAQLRQGGAQFLCPKDGSKLQHTMFEGFEVEQCLQCGGIWLDQHEAEALHRHEAAKPGLFRGLFGSLIPNRNA